MKFVINLLFSKKILTTHLNIYKIYWFYWLDLWIRYKIMPLFASFEQIFFKKHMPKLGFPNCFIVNMIKENVAQVFLTKSCVTLWLRHLDASMRSWNQTWAIDAHEFVCLVVYMCACGVRKAKVGTYQPTILSNNNVLTCGTIWMFPCSKT